MTKEDADRVITVIIAKMPKREQERWRRQSRRMESEMNELLEIFEDVGLTDEGGDPKNQDDYEATSSVLLGWFFLECFRERLHEGVGT